MKWSFLTSKHCNCVWRWFSFLKEDKDTSFSVDAHDDGYGNDDGWNSEDSDPFGDANSSSEFQFSDEDLNPIPLSFENSQDDTSALDQESGGASNGFKEGNQATIGSHNEWMEDESIARIGSSLFFALSIRILALCIMWRRGYPGQNTHTRTGYRPVPAKENRKRF